MPIAPIWPDTPEVYEDCGTVEDRLKCCIRKGIIAAQEGGCSSLTSSEVHQLCALLLEAFLALPEIVSLRRFYR